MKQHLEIEYKTKVSDDTVQKLLKTGLFKNPGFQHNDYFDTKDFKLYKQGVMCRVRSFEGDKNPEFTLKVPQEDGVLEHEVIVDGVSLNHPAIIELLDTFGIKLEDIHPVTFSETTRTIYADVYGEWCLDHSVFENDTDYELEYELFGPNDNALAHYKQHLIEWGIEFKEIDPKFIRALKSSKILL